MNFLKDKNAYIVFFGFLFLRIIVKSSHNSFSSETIFRILDTLLSMPILMIIMYFIYKWINPKFLNIVLFNIFLISFTIFQLIVTYFSHDLFDLPYLIGANLGILLVNFIYNYIKPKTN